jgi:hypothetical protein
VATTFRRVLTPAAILSAGDYTRCTESGRARLCCPLCACEFDLPPRFAPDQTGRVNYAVSCEATICGWWDWAVLADHWSEP